MKSYLHLKIMGDKESIREFISRLEETYTLVPTSDFIENADRGGFHIYVTVMTPNPKPKVRT